MRDENADNVAKSGTGDTHTQTAVLPNQNPKESSKQAKDTNNQRDNVNMNTGIRTLQDVLHGKNIEDVMKGFEQAKRGLSQKFQEILRDGGDKAKAEELTRQEVDIKVKELEKAGVKIDPVEGELFIKRFKEERIAEFEQLVEMIGEGKDISLGIDMKVKVGGREFAWRLELKDVKMMKEFFEKYINSQSRYEKERKDTKLKL